MKVVYGKKEPGVSPVIATILMVAITVVLAATVYLMVSGYMTGPSKPTLYATLTETQPITSAIKASVTLSMSSPSSLPVANLYFYINGTAATYSSTNTSWKWTDTASGHADVIFILWTSLTGNPTTVYSGDIFTVKATDGTATLLTGVTLQISTSVATGTSNTLKLS